MENMTDKRYATILIDEIAELNGQIKIATEEKAFRTVEMLEADRDWKQEKLNIIMDRK